MERAVLAVLVALEARPVGPGSQTRKNAKVTRQAVHLRVGMQEAIPGEALAGTPLPLIRAVECGSPVSEEAERPRGSWGAQTRA